jgi:hypothetical protein
MDDVNHDELEEPLLPFELHAVDEHGSGRLVGWTNDQNAAELLADVLRRLMGQDAIFVASPVVH